MQNVGVFGMSEFCNDLSKSWCKVSPYLTHRLVLESITVKGMVMFAEGSGEDARSF